MSQRTKIIRAALFTLVIGIGIYFVPGFMRRYLAQPIYFIGLYFFTAISSLPQQLIWSLLILVGVWVAFRVIINIRPPKRPKKEPEIYYPSRVETWERWLHLAGQGELYRLKLARELSSLTLTTLANREGESVANIRRRLQNGGILLPDEALKLINSTLVGSDISPVRRIIRRFTRNNQQPSINRELEETIRYLETELEVQSGESSH